MNAFWSLISQYLPSVRIYNDFDQDYPESDYDDELYRLPTTNPTTNARASGQRHDRMPLRIMDGSSNNNNNDKGQGRGAESRKSIENEQAQRIKELELLNQRLQSQVVSLQRQLEHLQSDVSSTKFELEHQRSSNSHLLSQKSKLEGELSQAQTARQTQHGELDQLRSSYANLAASLRPAGTHNEELAALKSFLDKTDEFTGSQILQAVQDLNTEIMQLAAAVSEEFPLSRRNADLSKESDFEILRNSIGDGMLELLREGDHEADPTVVQLAVQAWEVWCCREILSSFCFGAPTEADRFLTEVFREMQLSEPLPMTSQWRALTHAHARSVLAAYPGPAPAYPGSSSTSSLASPVSPPPYPTPNSTLNNTPASQTYALPPPASDAAAGSARTNVRGLLAVLAVAGCTDEQGIHREPLRARFGDAVMRIAERAEALARAMKEGVKSSWFEVIVERPLARPLVRPDLLKGKGEWKDEGRVWGKMFDAATMENLYAGYGTETARVLCTVEFGLKVVKRRKEDEGEQQPLKEAERSKGVLDTTLLLKPKVLLESVKELL